MIPYSDRPLKIKARRAGEPTTAEMQLLAQCVRGDGTVSLEHPKGEERSPILVLAFEMSERGWLLAPGEPTIRNVAERGEASPPSREYVEPTSTVRPARVWTFAVSEKGRQAYQAKMESFGVS